MITVRRFTFQPIGECSYLVSAPDGTAVIVDGAPMSNNANLQTLSPVVGGSSGDDSRSGTPARGMDVRTLSTDNIESIEVIRGIPSAEYGDHIRCGAGEIQGRKISAHDPFQDQSEHLSGFGG